MSMMCCLLRGVSRLCRVGSNFCTTPRRRSAFRAAATLELGLTSLFLGVLVFAAVPHVIVPYTAVRMEHAAASVMEVAETIVAARGDAALDADEIDGLHAVYRAVLGGPSASRHGLRIILIGRGDTDPAEMFSETVFGDLAPGFPVILSGDVLSVRGRNTPIPENTQAVLIAVGVSGPMGRTQQDHLLMLLRP